MINTNLLFTDLLNAAREGVKNAYTGSSNEEAPRFGAALLTGSGNIYSSGQYFSDTLSLTLHAEQAALAHAAAHGEYDIVAIVCVGNSGAYQMSGGTIYPCHLCKQLLWESYLRSGVNTEIFIIDAAGSLVGSLHIREMFNYPWPLKN